MEKPCNRPGKVCRFKLLKLLYTTAPWLTTLLKTVSAEEGVGIESITENIETAVSAIGGLMVLVALTFFAVGALCRYLPWASQRTKDFGGQIFDHSFILISLAATGGFLLAFAAQIAVGIVGQGKVPEFSNPWELGG